MSGSITPDSVTNSNAGQDAVTEQIDGLNSALTQQAQMSAANNAFSAQSNMLSSIMKAVSDAFSNAKLQA